jgi:hypothetical protein
LKSAGEKLNLNHRDMLYKRLKNINVKISEYSFANLFLFRNSHNYEIIVNQDDIFIKGITYSGESYIMPCKVIEQNDLEKVKSLMKTHGYLFPIPEEWLYLFNSDEYSFSYDEGESDYISLIEDIKTYSGKKLHSKKNLLNQFESKYKHDALPLTSERIDDAKYILEQWQESSGSIPEETDYYPCREALYLYDKLVLCGGIFYADDKPAGFILGEEIHDSVFALHFAKGLSGIKGIYQYMYNRFAHVMPDEYCCFNFEQDLGLESLRKAKLSYKTSELIKKYRISLKK